MAEGGPAPKRMRLEGPDFGQSTLSNTVESRAVQPEEGQNATVLERERQAGILSYMGKDVAKFSALLKTRYTDFIVNEVSLSNERLRLRSLQAPKTHAPHVADGQTDGETKVSDSVTPHSVTEQHAAAEKDVAQAPHSTEPSKPSAEDENFLQNLFGDKTVKQIVKLSDAVLANPQKKARDFTSFNSIPIDDRQKRAEAHQLIRRAFGSRVETTTEDDNTIKFIASPPKKKAASWTRNSGDGRSKGKLSWDQLGGEHVHFTLYKENKDTMEVVHYMCTQMKVQPRSFAFAGTKDRRAVTTQRLSAYRIHGERLAGLNKSLRGARIGDFKYEKQGLELGDLSGNHFTITLRDCGIPDSGEIPFEERLAELGKRLKHAAEGLSNRGFINYYGLQRFGSFEARTDLIGASMLRTEYKLAVEKILEYNPAALLAFETEGVEARISSDEAKRAGALKIWHNGGKVDEVLAILPRKFSAESNIIRHLGFTERKSGERPKKNDFKGALATIARNLRLMYVHAYQSFVWNNIASMRWELYGDRVVAGDLVVVSKTDKQDADQELDEQGEVIVRPAEHDTATSAEDAFERARPLSQAEVDSGKFSIFDVVLPQPGYDVEYPANETGKAYKEFMSSERGGRLDPHNMRRDWKDISLSGAYRPFLARPIGSVEVEVRRYESSLEQLVETDLEQLIREGKVDESMSLHLGDKQDANGERALEEATPKIATILKMQLGSSQYATMALREMSKGGIVAFQPAFSTKG